MNIFNISGRIIYEVPGSLVDADLSGADLSGADLRGQNLSNANLSNANLDHANLSGANLSNANLDHANLSGANLSRANLSYANLGSAALSRANLSYADLGSADLSGANLSGADLSGANLGSVDFSGALGLPVAAEFMREFKHSSSGITVYKRIGDTTFKIAEHWKIMPGAFLTEVVNTNRTDACGCGVNFGTRAYVEKYAPGEQLWECLIHWVDAWDVIVPYNQDGKARCARLQLIKRIDK